MEFPRVEVWEFEKLGISGRGFKEHFLLLSLQLLYKSQQIAQTTINCRSEAK